MRIKWKPVLVFSVLLAPLVWGPFVIAVAKTSNALLGLYGGGLGSKEGENFMYSALVQTSAFVSRLATAQSFCTGTLYFALSAQLASGLVDWGIDFLLRQLLLTVGQGVLTASFGSSLLGLDFAVKACFTLYYLAQTQLGKPWAWTNLYPIFSGGVVYLFLKTLVKYVFACQWFQRGLTAFGNFLKRLSGGLVEGTTAWIEWFASLVRKEMSSLLAVVDPLLRKGGRVSSWLGTLLRDPTEGGLPQESLVRMVVWSLLLYPLSGLFRSILSAGCENVAYWASYAEAATQSYVNVSYGSYTDQFWGLLTGTSTVASGGVDYVRAKYRPAPTIHVPGVGEVQSLQNTVRDRTYLEGLKSPWTLFGFEAGNRLNPNTPVPPPTSTTSVTVTSNGGVPKYGEIPATALTPAVNTYWENTALGDTTVIYEGVPLSDVQPLKHSIYGAAANAGLLPSRENTNLPSSGVQIAVEPMPWTAWFSQTGEQMTANIDKWVSDTGLLETIRAENLTKEVGAEASWSNSMWRTFYTMPAWLPLSLLVVYAAVSFSPGFVHEDEGDTVSSAEDYHRHLKNVATIQQRLEAYQRKIPLMIPLADIS